MNGNVRSMHVTPLIGEKEKMEDKEDEFLRGVLNVEEESLDREEEQEVQSEEPEVDECG